MLFRALASGSSGNAYLLRTEKVCLLFEAGLRMPALTKALAAEGVAPRDLTAVLISHEHRDHCVSAHDLASLHGVPVFANEAVLRAVGVQGLATAGVLELQKSMLFGDVEVVSFPVEHDAVCPVGFIVETNGRTISIATDLGNPSAYVEQAVSASDLIVLEANHDTEMLLNGRYPYHLRKRVSGPTGHLSNSQAAGVLAKHLKGDHVDVWLAHLSRENNTPALALKTVRRALSAAGLGSLAVGVALRDRPSLRWTGQARPRQLSLFPASEAV